jgi:hypothetical protein
MNKKMYKTILFNDFLNCTSSYWNCLIHTGNLLKTFMAEYLMPLDYANDSLA